MIVLKEILGNELRSRVPAAVWDWLTTSVTEFANKPQAFGVAFSAASRKTGKELVNPTSALRTEIQIACGVDIRTWTIDRLARIWLILHLPAADRQSYIDTIEKLFLTAEMNEQVALYSALPLLHYPEVWRHRCAEGIRSNIGPVLESIMCDNPYPSQQLDEPAWNQLVLKAIFTEKPVHRIVGLDRRANQRLAHTLSDYAHERWAAHRQVNPLLWRCVAGFVDERIFPDIERLVASDLETERVAAALVIKAGGYPGLAELGSRNTDLFENMKTTDWDGLANLAEHVS